MGDFNAQIGEGTLHSARGSFGYGRTNDRGELLLDWMEDNTFIALNTYFRHRQGNVTHGSLQMEKLKRKLTLSRSDKEIKTNV